MLTNKTGSVVKMEWSRWRECLGNVSVWVQEKRIWPHETKKALFPSEIKTKKQKKKATPDVGGRTTWVEPRDEEGKKCKQYNNMRIKLSREVCRIFNRSSPSGQVLWRESERERVSLRDISAHSTEPCTEAKQAPSFHDTHLDLDVLFYSD